MKPFKSVAAVLLCCVLTTAFPSCNPNDRFSGDASGMTVSAIISGENEENKLVEEKDVDTLLADIIESGPKASSNPGDYIEADREDYNRLVSMDTEALKEMFSQFEDTREAGLKGAIMALTCQEILGDEAITAENLGPVSDGSGWYQAYRSAIQKIRDTLSVKEMRAKYPKSMAVLPEIWGETEPDARTAAVIGLLDEMFDTGSAEIQYLPAGYTEGDEVLSFDISDMRARFRYLWREYLWKLVGNTASSALETISSTMKTSSAIRLRDNQNRMFTLYLDSNLAAYSDGASVALYQVTGNGDDSLWRAVRQEFDSLEASVENVTIETESTDFEEIARLFVEAFGEQLKTLTEGNMAKVTDFAIVNLRIMITEEGNDSVFCFDADYAARPIDENPGVYWYSGSGEDGTGKYEGYIIPYRQFRLEREGTVWRCTDSGTGGIRLYDDE